MKRSIAYIFPGQGIQKVGMGKKLLEKHESLIVAANDICGYSIKELCLKGPAERLNNTEFSQVAIFILNALYHIDYIEKNNESPIFCVGHSLGEYNALLAAKVFDFTTGLQIVKKRGELMAKVENGAMAAIVGLEVEKFQEILKQHDIEEVTISNINSPNQLVISGLASIIDKYIKLFNNVASCRCIKLNTSGAFHSPHMLSVRNEFKKYLSQFTFNEPTIKVISNAHLDIYTINSVVKNLSDHLIKPVNWLKTIHILLDEGITEFSEMSDAKLLTNMVGKIKLSYENKRLVVKENSDSSKRNINYSDDDIVVVGMACNFPQAATYEEFWENLVSSKFIVEEIREPRFNGNAYYSGKMGENNKIVSKWLSAIQDIDKFDNAFFNISDKDAVLMDPQQRLLLQEAWHCIEDSGIAIEELQKSITSVYVGAMAIDYLLRFVSDPDAIIEPKLCLNNYACTLANRISYHFDFKGVSQTSDAACASSILSLHQAVQALKIKETDFSIVGGVNILAHPLRYIDFSKSRMLSPDGVCRTFDAEANGYVQGEGIGCLLLTTLKVAKRLHCRVLGVIKSVVISHSGRGRNITVPSVDAQKLVIEKALEQADFSPKDISYIETHGTGTMLGDPIEVNALKAVFGSSEQCYIGSVKTNIGHLEAAAGMAGLIKVLLMLKNGKIPPSLNLKNENPLLGLKNSAIKIAKDNIQEWRYQTDQGRCAGISAFSFGGVNAHCIIQEFCPKNEKLIDLKLDENTKDSIPFMLSAKSKNSLIDLIKSWRLFFRTEKIQDYSLKEICLGLLLEENHFYIECLFFQKINTICKGF